MSGFVPLCMDTGELDAWQRTNARMTGLRAARPCDDCLPDFAAEMRAMGRCNGEPGTEREETPMTDATPTRGMPVSVALPCERCRHAAVCRIRSQLEALTDVSVGVRPLDPAVTLVLSATVECAHFDRGKVAGAPVVKRNWSPEARAAQAERMRAANAARAAERDAA